ncbi:hypothetical protein ACFQ4C_07405 [Larkinella insperata]|uniref:Uncharacterized protein n=1 Tax=Larkinella insperata TaxID=332158 RepID=A0ABW3Q6E9_9BACT
MLFTVGSKQKSGVNAPDEVRRQQVIGKRMLRWQVCAGVQIEQTLEETHRHAKTQKEDGGLVERFDHEKGWSARSGENGDSDVPTAEVVPI